MCGIVGVYDLEGKPVSHKLIISMRDKMAHRGPDAEGVYINKNIGLGHRRLAIIDLSEQGNQPMLNEDKRYVIVYNGIIYNYQDLRKKLEKLGHKFNCLLYTSPSPRD